VWGVHFTYVCRVEKSMRFVVVVPLLRQWFSPASYIDGSTFDYICELCVDCVREMVLCLQLFSLKVRGCYVVE
jgi:hypothetical protein